MQDAGGTAADLELFDRLRKRGELTLRVYQALRADATLTEAGLDELEQVRTRFADDPLLKTGAIKLIADGVIESHTAAMLEPYANRPAIKGDARFTPEQLNKVVAHARQARLAGDDARDRRRRRAHDARRLSRPRRRPIPRPSAAAAIASSTSRPSIPPTSRASASSA